MTPLQAFAKEHSVTLAEARYFRRMGELYAKAATHECNGDPHPDNPNPQDKNENARLWGITAAKYADNMETTAKKWGFHHLDFGVGFYPTLQKSESDSDGTVHFPYDD
jgi:hypothetical protein